MDTFTQEALLKSVKTAGLRYVRDNEAGYERKRLGRGFVYSFRSKRITDKKTLDRIQKLVIPPAWKGVWICVHENGHLQATGRDAKGRKQYKYHAEWTQTRNENKFSHLLKFGELLPSIRVRIDKDLKHKKFTKNKILASIVSIMQDTSIRIGNDVYAQENDSYGLTTLKNKHARISNKEVRLKFRGKSGVPHDATLQDQKIIQVVKHCQDLPGAELFAYQDEDGVTHDISSTDVNEYLKNISGDDITAKDFRTWSGTVKALEETVQCGPLDKTTKTAIKKRQLQVIRKVAEHLRNTVSVCRKYYVHPLVFECDEKGILCDLFHRMRKKILHLNKHELLLIKILRSDKTRSVSV